MRRREYITNWSKLQERSKRKDRTTKKSQEAKKEDNETKKGNKRLFIHRTKRGALFSLTVCSNREISLMNPYLHLHVPGWIALKMKSFLSNENTYEHGGIKISMKNGSQTKLVFEISNA